jgi:hypothetical protein
MSTAQEKERAIIDAVKRASGVVARLAQRLAGGVTSAYQRDKITRQLGAARQKQAAADAAYRTFQRQSAKSMKSLAAIKASTPTATPKPRNTAAALNQGMKNPKPKSTPKNISPEAKKAMNKAAAALSQSQIKNKPTPKPKNISAAAKKAMNRAGAALSQSQIKNKPTAKPRNTAADTSAFAKASAASVVKPIPTPRAKPKPPPRKARLAPSVGVPFKKLKANVPDNNLKTNLSAARKAGHLYYKNTKGDKMAAVSVADLKKSGFKDLQAFMNYQTDKTAREKK